MPAVDDIENGAYYEMRGILDLMMEEINCLLRMSMPPA